MIQSSFLTGQDASSVSLAFPAVFTLLCVCLWVCTLLHNSAQAGKKAKKAKIWCFGLCAATLLCACFSISFCSFLFFSLLICVSGPKLWQADELGRFLPWSVLHLISRLLANRSKINGCKKERTLQQFTDSPTCTFLLHVTICLHK